jgi:chromosome partitioning protein
MGYVGGPRSARDARSRLPICRAAKKRKNIDAPGIALPLNRSLTILSQVPPRPREAPMNVVTLASRKGGAGKSTLTAHLAACAHAAGRRCLLIDADPQGSLSLWQSLRADGQPPLQSAGRGIDRALAYASIEGYEWVFIDTAPTMWVVVQEAIRAATLVVIPARPGFFDLNAVRETVATARERDKPYAVVLNAAPSKRDAREMAVVAQSRAFLDKHQIPVWSGQISQRAGLALTLAAGKSACEIEPGSAAAAEIAGLWSAIERSVAAVNAAHAAARGGQGRAA